MSNLLRTPSLLLVVILAAAVGLAQEKKQEKKKKKDEPTVTARVLTEPLPAEYDPAAWKVYKSEAGRFSVLFPGTPQEETDKLQSGVHEVPIHILKFNALAAYALMYLDSPAAFDLPPEATRKMLDAHAKQAIATFQATTLQQKEVALDGHPGLAYMVRLPDGLIMRLRVYAVRSRLYQLMIVTPPEQGATDGQRRFYEATADKFLDSFKLTPLAEPAPVVSVQDAPEPPAPKRLPHAPVSGGVLNGKAVSKPDPVYPAAAVKERVEGLVTVAVVIDEEGRVSAAEAVSGPESLREAAVAAARKARFSPTRLSGQPVKISGRLVYNFVLR